MAIDSVNITNENQSNMTPNYQKRGNPAIQFEKRSSLPIVVETNPLKVKTVYGGEAFEGHNNYVNGGGTLVLGNENHLNQNLASKSSIRSKQFKPNRWTITKG